MKTILGKKVKKTTFRIYENVLPNGRKKEVNGMIWMDGDFFILIRRSKFLLNHKDGKSSGIIQKGTETYKKIKRMISRCFQVYRKHGAFNNGTEYWQSKCQKVLNDFSENRRNILLSNLQTDKFYQL